MEVNKDEAERCIEIALDAIKTGNVTRAEKFLNKAENLYPCQRAKGRESMTYISNNKKKYIKRYSPFSYI